MFIRILLVLTYIGYCLRYGVKPWFYFQLNAQYFNKELGIFSKLDIDKLIPKKWCLEQWQDSSSKSPRSYPVFIKPVWGQNSLGVKRIDSFEELELHRAKRPNVIDILQEAATGKTEYEIFYIPSKLENQKAIFSIVEVVNKESTELPVNGILNENTSYIDITDEIDVEDIEKIIKMLSSIGSFNISRTSIKANSVEHIMKENFQVIEINLYVPMPLNLLSINVTFPEKISFIFKAMKQLVLNTKSIPVEQEYKAIFFRKLGFMNKLKKR